MFRSAEAAEKPDPIEGEVRHFLSQGSGVAAGRLTVAERCIAGGQQQMADVAEVIDFPQRRLGAGRIVEDALGGRSCPRATGDAAVRRRRVPPYLENPISRAAVRISVAFGTALAARRLPTGSYDPKETLLRRGKWRSQRTAKSLFEAT